MDLILLAIGVLLLASVVIDLLWTTLWVEGGAGPLTSLLMAWIWGTLRRLGGSDSRVLTLSGPVILVGSLATWIGLLWGGWTFVFASGESSIIDTLNRDPVSWSDWVYFAGYTIFTLGNGDFVPQEGFWQIMTTLTTASGMLFVTLSVTYVLNVLSAVTQKRSFASGVSGLGSNGAGILCTSWNGEELEGLALPLNTFTTQLNALTSNHKAYPILHYFHSKQAGQSPTVSVAIFDETLSLLQFGLSERSHPSNTILRNARSSVEGYLNTLQSSFIEPADRSPPPPSLDTLRERELPTVSDEEFITALADMEERRRTLLGLVESDEREWPSPDDE
ncbi:two pore domain potassium channel family protein [Halorubellus sp. JP-L1]|uniref:potassium channel family protein n=1 Tax=Halorubellus sp. JP-L1 TaxID=2715753 RepID=UPI00140B89E0|nr:potassium channel family protein [Halorubellus sp. JP-L1]NHN42989.1 two pore domain potassium channel family protein [Halorubellus sp. JP-L1]